MVAHTKVFFLASEKLNFGNIKAKHMTALANISVRIDKNKSIVLNILQIEIIRDQLYVRETFGD